MHLYENYTKRQYFLEKETLHKKLYPGLEYKDARIRQLLTLLHKLLQDFLILEFRKNEKQDSIDLLKIYEQENQAKHFESQEKRIEKQFQGLSIQTLETLYQQADRAAIQYRYQVKNRRAGYESLSRWIQYSDLFFYAQKLEHACLAWAETTVNQQEFDLPLLDSILLEIESRGLETNPLIGAYYYCYQALRSDLQEGYFDLLIQKLDQYKQELTPETLRSVYLLALNFCIRRYNAGDKAFLPTEFDLYKAGLESGYLISEGRLSRFTYRNIMTVCIALEDWKFAESFTIQYRDFLDAKFAESSYHFNMARLTYHKKDYSSAEKHLQQTEFEELFVQLAARVVQIKISHETESTDLLQAQLANLKKFLYRRKKELGYHLENYQNFVKFAEKLPAFQFWSKTKQSDYLNRLHATPNCADREWLIDQTI